MHQQTTCLIRSQTLIQMCFFSQETLDNKKWFTFLKLQLLIRSQSISVNALLWVGGIVQHGVGHQRLPVHSRIQLVSQILTQAGHTWYTVLAKKVDAVRDLLMWWGGDRGNHEKKSDTQGRRHEILTGSGGDKTEYVVFYDIRQ